MNSSSKMVRQSNIELLRIIAMIMVIGHHLSFFGGVEFDAMSISVNRLWTQFLVYGGHVGVDIFVLISGYFMINQKSLKLDKIVKLWLMMLFYSVGMYVVAIAFFGYPIETRLIVIALTPFLNEQWPFASAFLALMMVAPFVNVVLNRISKSAYRVFLAMCVILWVVIPTFTTFEAQGNYLIWMIVLYAMAGYVRLYPEDCKRSAKWYILGGVVMALLSYASAVVFDLLGIKYQIFAEYATHFSGMQHANIVLWAILFFIGFVKLGDEDNIGSDYRSGSCSRIGDNANDSTKNKRSGFLQGKSGMVINYIASLMFGVYLMHEDFFGREILWERIFDNNKYSGSGAYILITIGEIVAILVVGSVVEWIRANLLEKWYMKAIKKALVKPQERINGCMKDV